MFYKIRSKVSQLTIYLVAVAVARFVKYTGYGNAAGLLAQRGLLCGGSGADYSSESDDSETEEYTQLRDRYEHGSCRLLSTLQLKLSQYPVTQAHP